MHSTHGRSMRMRQVGKVCPLPKNLCFFHGKNTKKYRIPRFITTFVVQNKSMERLEQIKQPISVEFEVFKQREDDASHADLINS